MTERRFCQGILTVMFMTSSPVAQVKRQSHSLAIAPDC